jgi:hypothetical protein
VGIFFLKAAILTLFGVVERPLARMQGFCTGKKVAVAVTGLLWSCPVMNFAAKLPSYGMM